MAPSAVDDSAMEIDSEPTYPPPKTYPVREIRFEKPVEEQPEGRELALTKYAGSAAIVIDNGSSTVRAGWSFDKQPRIAIPPIMAKFRERKLGKTFSLAGTDCYVDTTARNHIRNAFEAGTGIVTNWDVMEHVLDYVFLKLGMNGADTSINVPIVMTEPVANLPYCRKTMTEIMFECYNVPSVTYGIDSLFSYKYNKGNTGIVVSSSYTSTHVIPVYRSKAILSQAVRLNWGGWHGAEYLLKLIKLKYPNFPGKLNASQAEYMIRDHCYVSTDYSQELSRYLDWTGLEDRERVIQYPYTEEVVVQKTEEELARIAERKKESGRRLQEQAAKMRLEKLMRKEEELAYYKDLQRRISEQTNKKEVKRLLDADELRDEAALDRTIRELERSIKRARQKDVGGEAEEEAGEPVFDLLDVPDDQLDEAGLKAKRQQKLLKSNYEARQRAKAEKEAERQRIEEERRLDEERREKDREGWIAGRRQQLAATLARLKERQRIRQDMSNRKSLASQMRMKSIANLASDAPGKKRRRAGGGGDQDDDDFGANDDDWGVYRQIQVGGDDEGRGEGGGSDDEEGGGGEEEIMNTIRSIEADLLRYDPDFRREDTWDAQHSWDKSLLHAFMRGPRPFDEGSAAQLHQVVLNVERIRVPEVVFQPSIAGVDQAGLAEIVGTLLRQRLAYPIEQQAENGTPTGSTVLLRDQLLRDVFLTGGNTLFKGFDERLRAELAPQLPPSAPLAIRRASDPVLDAWRGAAEWVGTDSWRAAQVTREEYLEKGGEYIKEHDMGNAAV